MTYKKRSRQQYVLERKRVLSKVETKLKKASRKSETGFQTTVKPMAIAPTPEETEVSLPKGQPATLHYKGETVKVSAKIRYETMKTEPLIKTVNVADGKIVHRKFVGPEKKLVWMDDEGKEHDKKDVKLMQQHVDGSLTPIQITKTKDITVEPIDPEVMGAFQPYSFIEIWGEDDTASDSLREFAYDLVKNKKVGAVKKFSHGSGKVYVGFVHPIISNDGKSFSLELMVSENKKKYRRWMPAEPEATPKRKVKAEEPEIPEMW